MKFSNNPYMPTAIIAVKAAAKILLKYLISSKPIKSLPKTENDIETEVDVISGNIIKKIIQKKFPNHSIVLEEKQLNNIHTSRFLWVIDSIEGTINYDGKIPYFGINIALVKNNTPLIGLHYVPYTDDLYIAVKGKGAFHINKRFNLEKKMHVNSIADPSQGILIINSGKALEKRLWTAKFINNVISYFRQVERFCDGREAGLLGTTKIVGYVCNSANYWDFIAHKIIIEESGGKTSDFENKELNKTSHTVIYSNSTLHDFIYRIVKKSSV